MLFNLLYFVVLAYLGYRIIDLLGFNGSDYDWIQVELDREKEELEYMQREKEEERKVSI